MTTVLRSLAMVTFAGSIALVVACGHQVTPEPARNDLAGDMAITFELNGPLDFTDYTYAIVIDTCGIGTPHPQAYQTTFDNYSYAFFIGASQAVGVPLLTQYYVKPNSTGIILSRQIQENSSTEQFLTSGGLTSNEFELIFNRRELANPSEQSQPCPNIPAITATASPSASALGSPNPYPTEAAQQTWYVNFFTIQSGTIVDSIGTGGFQDTSFDSFAIDTAAMQDVPYFKPAGGTGSPSNPSAQISGGEIRNYP